MLEGPSSSGAAVVAVAVADPCVDDDPCTDWTPSLLEVGLVEATPVPPAPRSCRVSFLDPPGEVSSSEEGVSYELPSAKR